VTGAPRAASASTLLSPVRIMCGIAGTFDLTGRGRTSLATVTRMSRVLSHRGPDRRREGTRGDLAFGFRGLAIVDPEHGDQPMESEDGSILSMCNGEIFNHQQLRESLSVQGHRFRTRCDVEVLPHLYEEYGDALVRQLRGQFAFAIHDGVRNTLLLARDHFGVVPLFYTVADGFFLFASEIKALLEHPSVSRAVNLTGLDQVLCFPGLASPTTMFAGIESVPSGHYVTVSSDGVSVREYWDLCFPRESAPVRSADTHYAEALEEHLRRSVRARLMSDVPLGLYLSGGLDSSVVTALACEDDRERRHSFGISFAGADHCEGRYQRQVAQAVGTQHHDVPFRPPDAAHLDALVYHTECPVKETYDVACLALSRAAKDANVSVVLTGQGADELLGGYIGYRFDRYHAGKPRHGEREARERRIREQLWGDPGLAYDGDYAGLQDLKQQLYSAAMRARLPEVECFGRLPVRADRIAGRHVFHQRSYLDFKLRLADHLLGDHGDRMAMANSVEPRHPFLDVELVEFVATIPPDAMIDGLTEKHLLRAVGRRLLPAPVVDREKFAWYAPGTPQLLQSRDPYVRDLLSPDRIRRQGYFDPAMVEQLTARDSTPGFQLNQPFETDLLMIVLTFTAFVDRFRLPALE
jgi:asparagine synthase (glutamine-hydrolysing)